MTRREWPKSPGEKIFPPKQEQVTLTEDDCQSLQNLVIQLEALAIWFKQNFKPAFGGLLDAMKGKTGAMPESQARKQLAAVVESSAVWPSIYFLSNETLTQAFETFCRKKHNIALNDLQFFRDLKTGNYLYPASESMANWMDELSKAKIAAKEFLERHQPVNYAKK